jgi:chloramphenicol-sensitive protein RarD
VLALDTPPSHHSESSGIAYVGLAYVLWSVAPFYWRQLSGISAVELSAHRALWCAVFAAFMVLARGNLPKVIALVRSRRVLGTLLLTSFLIGANWTLYIYCVLTSQLVEASLGYFLTPIISFALGFIFFGERMSRLRLVGAILAVFAVVLKTAAIGHISWIAPGIASFFAFYGYFRKRVSVGAIEGLMVETWLLMPITLGAVIYWAIQRGSFFPSPDLLKQAFTLGTGPITAIPLAMFAAGVTQIRLTTLGFLQFIQPLVTLGLAIFIFHEPFSNADAVIFACVFLSLVLVTFENQLSMLLARRVPASYHGPVQ